MDRIVSPHFGDRDMIGHPITTGGGSGMIGLQEMLLQTNGEQILLFPAWPKEWNVHFKLHARAKQQ